jgi:hypothetical protein
VSSVLIDHSGPPCELVRILEEKADTRTFFERIVKDLVTNALKHSERASMVSPTDSTTSEYTKGVESRFLHASSPEPTLPDEDLLPPIHTRTSTLAEPKITIFQEIMIIALKVIQSEKRPSHTPSDSSQSKVSFLNPASIHFCKSFEKLPV